MTPSISRRRNQRRRLFVGMALGALSGLALERRRAAPRRAHRLDLWQRLLASRMDEVDAALLAARVQARFEELFAHRPRFTQRALRMHLERHILPGLALYQVLREVRGDTQGALAEWDALMGAPENSEMRQALKVLNHLPRAFTIFRMAVRRRIERDFPPEGWTVDWAEDSDGRVAFNIRRCFFQRVLTAYGAPELTKHYCQLDDLAAEALPPSIVWARTTTLARGGPQCDFCWTHVGSNGQA